MFIFDKEPRDASKVFASKYVKCPLCFEMVSLQLWPEKFQNKTNGVTPRRWLSFCNPELSAVITKWLGSEEWVLDTEQLAGLRNVRTFLNPEVC